MTNNELSRNVLELLVAQEGSMRFKDLAGVLEVDARALFKNLFFLEERGLVSLATSYPNDVVYPQIHLVRLRQDGQSLAADPERLDQVFPLSDTSVDTLLHIPPDVGGPKPVTYARVLDLLAARLRQSLQGEECDATLEKLESLLSLPFIHDPINLDSNKK